MQRSLPFLIWVISLGDMLPFRYLLRINAYLPVAGSLRFRLPGRGCYRTESSRKMSLYRFKRIRDILRLLKLHRQGDDVPSLSDAEIVS